MLKRLADAGAYMDFVNEINGDPDFHNPTLADEEQIQSHLLDSPNRPSHQLWGTFDGEALTGLFSFLVLEEEAYIEMLAGLSRSLPAYEEMLAFLKGRYKGYQADFVYNPNNGLLHRLLQKDGAEFDIEQRKMTLQKDISYQSGHQIELYCPEYQEQYRSLHRDIGYWTADKVIGAPDKFRIVLAVERGEVVGYIDVTHKYEENEPYDVFVKEAYRKKGYGKAMLAKAVELNRPKGMMLQVDVDNTAAIALYESMGFVTSAGENSITAHTLL